jgi:hypothetical protein
VIQQFLFGYQDGHRMLASSDDSDQDFAWFLQRISDAPNSFASVPEGGITFGFPSDGGRYVLGRTWPAPEANRPGAVWTHILVLPHAYLQDPLAAAQLLKRPREAPFHEYRLALDLQSSRSLPSESPQAWKLIFLLAAKPRSAIRCATKNNPIDVLNDAFHLARPDLVSTLSFVTDSEKRHPIDGKSFDVVVIHGSPRDEDMFSLDEPGLRTDSTRMVKSWRLLHGAAQRSDWLATVMQTLPSNRNSLKLVLETIALHDSTYEEAAEILGRVETVYPRPEQAIDLKRHIVDLAGLQSRLQLTRHLLIQGSWSTWKSAISVEDAVAALAASPADFARLPASGKPSPERSAVLQQLADEMSPKPFQFVVQENLALAQELLQHNPGLLAHIPEHDPNIEILAHAAARGGKSQRLEHLAWMAMLPSFVRGITFTAFRRANQGTIHHEGARAILSGKWDDLTPMARELVRGTPGIIPACLALGSTETSLNRIAEALGRFNVEQALLQLPAERQTEFAIAMARSSWFEFLLSSYKEGTLNVSPSDFAIAMTLRLKTERDKKKRKLVQTWHALDSTRIDQAMQLISPEAVGIESEDEQ